MSTEIDYQEWFDDLYNKLPTPSAAKNFWDEFRQASLKYASAAVSEDRVKMLKSEELSAEAQTFTVTSDLLSFEALFDPIGGLILYRFAAFGFEITRNREFFSMHGIIQPSKSGFSPLDAEFVPALEDQRFQRLDDYQLKNWSLANRFARWAMEQLLLSRKEHLVRYMSRANSE